MPSAKIVIVGAGSLSFGVSTIADILLEPGLRGSTLALVDIDVGALDLVAALAKQANEQWGSGMKIERTTDRRRALPDADAVIVSVEVEREKRWRLDWEIPAKYGVIQPMGENGGPGGFAHAMRNLPIVVGLCRDMERLCPDAWLLNFTNPVHRLTLAAVRHSAINAIGLCHGIYGTRGYLARTLGVKDEALDVKAAGINHFTWILDARLLPSGKDAYPAIRRAAPKGAVEHWGLSWKMLDAFGLFPSPGDDHIAEYLHWFHCDRYPSAAKYHLPTRRWEGLNRGRRRLQQRAKQTLEGKLSNEWMRRRSGEHAADIILDRLADRNRLDLAVNIPNRGYVTNLPFDGVVEVPALISAFGVQGLPMGRLPSAIAAICQLQMRIAELTVDAAVKRSRKLALQALLLDPMINDLEVAERILADFQRAHKGLMPELR